MLVPVPDPVKGRKWRECDGCGLHRKPRPRVDGELHPGDHPEDDGGHRPSAAAGARGPRPAGGRGRPAAGLVDEKELLRYTPSEATTLDVYELHDVLEKMTVGRIACPAHGVRGARCAAGGSGAAHAEHAQRRGSGRRRRMPARLGDLRVPCSGGGRRAGSRWRSGDPGGVARLMRPGENWEEGRDLEHLCRQNLSRGTHRSVS